MSTTRQTRGGLAAWCAGFIGASRQLFVNVTTGDVHVGDGVTAGGFGGTGILQRAKEYADTLYTVKPLAKGQINGLTVQNNATDATNDLDVLSGAARDDTDAADIVLPLTTTKRLDANWAAGSGSGGLDTGVKANSTTYHVWLILNPTTDAVDVLFSASATNPTMPSGFTQKRRVSSIPVNSSGSFVAFKQNGDYFGLVEPRSQYTGVNNGAVLRTLTDFPKGKKFKAHLAITQSSVASATSYFGIKDPDEGVATLVDWTSLSAAVNQPAGGPMEVYSNTVGQIYYYGQRADTTVGSAYLKGWTDMRERTA